MTEERYYSRGYSEDEANKLKGDKEIVRLENEVVSRLRVLMDSEDLSEGSFKETAKLLESYYYEVLSCGFNVLCDYGTESIGRLLNFLLSYPVTHNINKKYIEKMYDRLCLINVSTYILTQYCKMKIKCDLIKGYMNHIKGTIIEARSAFCLYRVNAEYIRYSYEFYSMDKLSPKDLYYGITTGYYEMSGNGSISLGKQAVRRLKKMCAYNELNRLKKDGFLLELYL